MADAATIPSTPGGPSTPAPSKRKRTDDDHRPTMSAYVPDCMLVDSDGITIDGIGPQCTPEEFCFYCEFNATNETGDKCLLTESKSVLRTNLHGRREIGHIIDLVSNHYNTNIKPNLTYCHRRSKQHISQPEWSRRSIYRHLFFSNEFPEAFDVISEFTLRAVCMHLNTTMVFSDTNTINERARVGLINTLDAIQRLRNVKSKYK